MNIDNHWLDESRHVLSPNYNDFPENYVLRLIVIHCISLPPGDFGGPHIEAFFCNCLDKALNPYFEHIAELKVSAHLLIRRSGEIIQFVPFNKRAWHAGVSSYQGVSSCNDFSLGIELEGCETVAYEEIQYSQLAQVIQCLVRSYSNFSFEHIAGHSDIAPGRKTDPGSAFKWDKLRALLSDPNL